MHVLASERVPPHEDTKALTHCEIIWKIEKERERRGRRKEGKEERGGGGGIIFD